MKVIHLNEHFNIGNVETQKGMYTCVPTVMRMLLNRQDVPDWNGTDMFFDCERKRGKLVITGFDSFEPKAADWLKENGYTAKWSKDKPKDVASLLITLSNTGDDGHAILCLGDMGYIDPWTGRFSIDLDTTGRPINGGYVTFERSGA